MADSIVKNIDVTEANGFCQGHFPGHPIVPAAVQAQWAIDLMNEHIGTTGSWRMQQAKFLRELLLGNQVELHLDQEKGKWRVQLVDTDGVIADMQFSHHE